MKGLRIEAAKADSGGSVVTVKTETGDERSVKVDVRISFLCGHS